MAARASQLFDAAFLTRGLVASDFWDPRHYLPHVYNKLNAALLWQLYGEPRGCNGFNRGRCSGREPVDSVAPPELSADARAAVAAARGAASGTDLWPGVATTAPRHWSVLQAVLWMSEHDIVFDAKSAVGSTLVPEGVNGSVLLSALDDPKRLERIGIKKEQEQQKLRTLLRAAEQRVARRGAKRE